MRRIPPRWMFTHGPLAILALHACFAADLEHRIAAAAGNPPAAFGIAGIHVVDAATGVTLYGSNEDRFFLPASNLKLFTTALAIERLGPDYRFRTRVLRDASGDLILVGAGDPSLSGRLYPYRKDAPPGPPLDPTEDLAAQIVASGIRRVEGDIVGDDRLYPWVPYPPSWSADDMERDYGAPVSALSLDDNAIAVTIQAGERAGDHASLSMSPAVEFLTIDHRVVTGPRASSLAIHVRQVPGSRQWIVTGSIPLGHAPASELIPVDDPAAFAARALYDALTRRGIAIRGRPVARHRAPGMEYAAPEGEEIAFRLSPPLAELLRVVEKVSQNLHAELVLREVGRLRRADGTTEAGLEVMSGFLKSLGAVPAQGRAPEIRGTEARLDDGSGLGRNTLVTPRLLTRLLTREYASNNRELWVSLLPVGGEDGTLEHRLCCARGAAGIHAKTGTLGRAIALSGYAFGAPPDAKKAPVAFSILVNDFSAPVADVRAWVDRIALALLE